MMATDRRTFLLALSATLATRPLSADGVAEQGLFWKAAPPGKPASILFGYARTAAAVAGAVVGDGERFARQCAMLIADVPNVRFPTTTIDRQKMTPVLSRVPTKLGDSIRLLLDQRFPTLPGRIGMTGLELALLLQSEGQTPPTPSVGGTIAEDAQKSGRPVAHLLSQQEYVAGYHAPDLTALDQSVGVGSIDYLMSLRGTRGPIGKYQEDLYVARRVGDLARLGDEMRAHGIPSVTDFAGLPTKQLQTTIAAKALKAVQTAAGPLFLMLPVGTFMGNEGVLARAASVGVPIKALA